MPDTLDGLSMDLEQTNLDKLRAVFPECFAEGKLDIDKLLGLCGEYIDNDFEKYRFEWTGKAECLRLAQKRSAGTLRPCVEGSVNWDTTRNLYIEGDNLEVLKLLQSAYYRKVKMIILIRLTTLGTTSYTPTTLPIHWRGIRRSQHKPPSPTRKPWDGSIQIG